jgi:hypothetical protein
MTGTTGHPGGQSMSTTLTTKQPSEVLSRHNAGVVVGFYLLTLLTGGFFLLFGGRLGLVVDLTATVSYIAVTMLFYALVKKPREL